MGPPRSAGPPAFTVIALERGKSPTLLSTNAVRACDFTSVLPTGAVASAAAWIEGIRDIRGRKRRTIPPVTFALHKEVACRCDGARQSGDTGYRVGVRGGAVAQRPTGQAHGGGTRVVELDEPVGGGTTTPTPLR